MKKTLTINLAGFVFHIEEDAYSILEKYLDSIHQYFQSFEGSKEIIADIESRIAEKFFEIREIQKTEAISIEHVNNLIASLGTVADFKEYETSEQSGQSEEPRVSTLGNGQSEEKKQFRRDLSRKKLGGVASGLANYWEVDPLWVRLVMVVGFLGLIPLLHFSNVLFWGYIICWIAIPGEYPEENRMSYKRFYRDPDNKVIGGVIAGISKYTGWDLGLLRVFAVISILVFGTGILAYLIIMAITPEAKTITEKMDMEGEPITLENIEQKFQSHIDSDNKAESFFAKILLFPFRIFAAILPAFKGLLNVIRWIVQYVVGGALIIVALAIMVGLSIISSVGISGFDHGIIQVQFWEAIPIFLLRNDLPSWSIIAIIFAILPILVSIGIAGVSLLGNKKYYNKTFSYISVGMCILGWIGIFYTIAIVGGHFSRTAATNNIVEYAVADSTQSLHLDIKKESQESIFEKMLGEHALKEEFLEDEDLHDFNRNGFNRVHIELEGYEGNKIQVIELFKSNGSTRSEAQTNAHAITYGVSQVQKTLFFDSHFGVKNKKFRNQRVKIKVLIPYGMNFTMSKDYAYFIENLISSSYFEEEELTFKNALWKFEKNQGLICTNRSVGENKEDLKNGEQWDDFEKRFEEKEKNESNATY
jgi:phage shock protein PspC (stress-responsive transcriptional regulator)